MKTKDRIRQICGELKISQRKFAQSIGLKPTSLAPIVSGKNVVSQVLANSIELKYKYKAEWILTGEGKKTAAESNPKDDHQQAYNTMLAYASEALFDESRIGVFAEAGIMKWIENSVEEEQAEYIKKKSRDCEEKELFYDIGKKTKELARLKKSLKTKLDKAFETLNNMARIVVMLDIYLVIIEEVEFEELKFDKFKLYYVYQRTYSSKVLPLVKATTKIIYKMYELWEVD